MAGRSTVAGIRFPAPRSREAAELSKLIDQRLALDAKLDALDVAQREASQRAQNLSERLAELERRSAAGAKTTKAERSQLEAELAAAKAAIAEPWAERRAGVEQAARDADRRLTTFVGENLDALLAELAEEGGAAAASVDAACHALVTAYHGRQQVESRLAALCALVRVPRVGDVAGTRAEQVVREAGKLLEAGGEMPPALRADPRQPRYAEKIVEADELDPVPAA